jgi:hypothetical protein
MLKATSYIVIDGCIAFGPIDLRMAIIILFASYYVINTSYPSDVAATLEFLEVTY